MTDGATIALAIISSGAFTTAVNAGINAIQNKKSKKNGVEKRLENIENEMREIKEQGNQNTLSLLRLTVMDSDMPMSERLIAGKKYIENDGNGDVKAFYKALEESVNAEGKDKG